MRIKELKDIFGYFNFLQKSEVLKRLKKELAARARQLPGVTDVSVNLVELRCAGQRPHVGVPAEAHLECDGHAHGALHAERLPRLDRRRRRGDGDGSKPCEPASHVEVLRDHPVGEAVEQGRQGALRDARPTHTVG